MAATTMRIKPCPFLHAVHIWDMLKKKGGLPIAIAAILIFFYSSMSAPNYILLSHTHLVTFLILSQLTCTYTHNAKC